MQAAWLRANAIPLAGTRPGSGDADLHPLGRLIGDARVVALGEASHGTHEFFALRHRLTAYLVRELGFTHVAVEANWAEAELVNEWVGGGDGDPLDMLDALHAWFYRTQEMLDFLHWLRGHNAGVDSGIPLRFNGIDMQFPALAISNVLHFIESVDPTALAVFTAWYADFEPYATRLIPLTNASRFGYANTRESFREHCRVQVNMALDALHDRRLMLETRGSPAAFARAYQSARLVVQAEKYLSYNAGLLDESNAVRDRAMADNVEWMLEEAQNRSKVIVWAHNAHVGAFSTSPQPASMGSYLRGRFGADYFSCGLTFCDGAFNAITPTPSEGGFRSPTRQEATMVPEDSFEHILRQAELATLVLDLRMRRDDSIGARWLSETHRLRSIGTIYQDTSPDLFYASLNLAEVFDAVAYIEHSTPSALLPSKVSSRY